MKNKTIWEAAADTIKARDLRLKRARAVFGRDAGGELVDVTDVGGELYVFTTELGALRIFQKRRGTGRVGYSKTACLWFYADGIVQCG